MEKSRDAFRTISEVAEWLDVPTHVLRFWESRFAQIKPVKRAGGRRYYRPSDMRVIGGVKSLLHDQGMTIRGVQKLFREKGIKHVSSFSPDLFEDTAGDIVEATASDVTVEGPEELPFIPARPAPSAAATGTRSATPAPVQDDLAANAPHTSDEAEPAETIEEAAAEAADDALAEQTIFASRRNEDADTAPDTPQAPRIPATPNVPDTDPDDEDVAHASAPSPAARLALARARDLRPHREALSAARDRLSALRERFE